MTFIQSDPVANIIIDSSRIVDMDGKPDWLPHWVSWMFILVFGPILLCILGAIAGFPVYAFIWLVVPSGRSTYTTTEYLGFVSLLCLCEYPWMALCIPALRHIAVRFLALVIFIATAVVAISSIPAPIVTVSQAMLFCLLLYVCVLVICGMAATCLEYGTVDDRVIVVIGTQGNDDGV